MKKLLRSLLILMCIASSAVAQNRTITGTVTDSQDGKPLPGVTVKIKGSQIGTITSADGKYAITVSGNSPWNFPIWVMLPHLKQLLQIH